MLVLPSRSGAHQDTDLLSPAKWRKGALLFHTAPTQPGGSGTGRVQRLVLVLCCAKSWAGNWLLLLSFRETVLEAQQGRKHMLQMGSKSIMAKVVVYTAGKDLQSCCFFPRRTGLSNTSLHVVSQSENWCSWKPSCIFYWVRSPVARAWGTASSPDWGTSLCDHSPLGNTACMQSLILQTCNSHVQYSASPSSGAKPYFVRAFMI